jgi:hypothetical protein
MVAASREVALDFALHEKQWIAFNTRATEVLFGGSAGGSKSAFLRFCSVIWASRVPNLQIYLFRRLLPDLTKTHLEGPKGYRALLNPLVETKRVQITEDEVRFLWNNSKIFLCHCQEEKDVNKYLSSEIHLLLIDEATQFTEYMVRFLRMRCRAVGLNLPDEYKGLLPRIYYASNPGGPGHEFFKRCFIDPVPEMDVWHTPPEEGGMMRQYIPSRLKDNPSMFKDDPTYADRIKGLGSPDLVKAYLEGDWNAVLGAFFSEFSILEHVLPAFKIPQHWTRFLSFDWGSYDPFAALWWTVSSEEMVIDGRIIPKESLICYREWYGAQAGTDKGLKLSLQEIERGIKDRELGEKIDYRVGSPDLHKHRGGPSIAEGWAMHGLVFLKADDAREAGWAEMRRRLVGENGRPTIYYFNTCRNCIRTIPSLQHDIHKQEDMASKNVPDHCAESSRYAAMSRPYASNRPKVTDPMEPFTNPKGIDRMTYNRLIELESRFNRKRR